jgi:hypothetical protein
MQAPAAQPAGVFYQDKRMMVASRKRAASLAGVRAERVMATASTNTARVYLILRDRTGKPIFLSIG